MIKDNIKAIFASKYTQILILTLVLGIFLRFLFFPGNTYFGYDQARDAYAAEELIKGDLKIFGPPSAFIPELRHGVLYYYIAAPVLSFAQGDPAVLSVFLRLVNVIGVILICIIGSKLFNKRVGLIAAFLFAISFEQTQYAIFMSHAALGVISVLLLYLGIALFYKEKNPKGYIVAGLGLGLSMQFHISLAYLSPLLLFFVLISFKKKKKLPIKHIAIAMTLFFATISSIMISVIKNGFTVESLFTKVGSSSIGFLSKLQHLTLIIHRYVHDNLLMTSIVLISMIVFGLIAFFLLREREKRTSGIIVILWFMWGLIPYYLTVSSTYHFSIGTSLALLIMMAFAADRLMRKYMILGILLLVVILFSNISLIVKNNPTGSIHAITTQNGMILKDELALLDYTYQQAKGEPFAINALTNPYGINTTWSYLYAHQGKRKYGYIPVWGGSHATGFASSLQVVTSRSDLPRTRFLIVEPVHDLLNAKIIKDFMEEENIFTKVVETKKFGLLTVYKQVQR